MTLGVRSVIVYYWPVVLGWALLTGAYAFLAALHATAAAALIAVLFLGAVVWCFLMVTNVEDWWDGFRRQRRLATVTGIMLLVTLASGVGFGWWLTA